MFNLFGHFGHAAQVARVGRGGLRHLKVAAGFSPQLDARGEFGHRAQHFGGFALGDGQRFGALQGRFATAVVGGDDDGGQDFGGVGTVFDGGVQLVVGGVAAGFEGEDVSGEEFGVGAVGGADLFAPEVAEGFGVGCVGELFLDDVAGGVAAAGEFVGLFVGGGEGEVPVFAGGGDFQSEAAQGGRAFERFGFAQDGEGFVQFAAGAGGQGAGEGGDFAVAAVGRGAQPSVASPAFAAFVGGFGGEQSAGGGGGVGFVLRQLCETPQGASGVAEAEGAESFGEGLGSALVRAVSAPPVEMFAEEDDEAEDFQRQPQQRENEKRRGEGEIQRRLGPPFAVGDEDGFA